MTVENMVDQAQEAHACGLVRGTTQRVYGLYGQVTEYSPMLKNGLESVYSRIPASVIDRVTAAAEPVIDGLDTQLEQVHKVSLSAIAATEAKVGQWKSMRGDLSKKAVVRMEKGLTVVREFSANRGKEMLHFDLVEYSQQVLDNANTVAKPLYEPVQNNLAAAVIKLNNAVSSLQEHALAKSADLQARLLLAIKAARDLSATSVSYVQQKYETAAKVCADEEKLQSMASQLPFPASDAIQFILQSPHLFMQVRSKADLDASKRIIDNARSLLAAVKEVVFKDVRAVESSEPSL